MQENRNIIDCYNTTAISYAEKFIDELQHKHLDRILLQSFAAENIHNGRTIDLGCGPGQATKYLWDCGLMDIIGVDISTAMVEAAEKIHPLLTFETGDILNLNYPDTSFGSAIAFYSIIHFDYEKLKAAFKEIKRVLKDNGQILFSFHVGDKVLHLNNFLNHSVHIDFYFFETKTIVGLLAEAGFEIIDIIEREPYPEVEYPSKRAYIWAKNSERRTM